MVVPDSIHHPKTCYWVHSRPCVCMRVFVCMPTPFYPQLATTDSPEPNKQPSLTTPRHIVGCSQDSAAAAPRPRLSPTHRSVDECHSRHQSLLQVCMCMYVYACVCVCVCVCQWARVGLGGLPVASHPYDGGANVCSVIFEARTANCRRSYAYRAASSLSRLPFPHPNSAQNLILTLTPKARP